MISTQNGVHLMSKLVDSVVGISLCQSR